MSCSHHPLPVRGTEEGGRLRLAALVEQRGLGLRVARQVVHTSPRNGKNGPGAMAVAGGSINCPILGTHWVIYVYGYKWKLDIET